MTVDRKSAHSATDRNLDPSKSETEPNSERSKNRHPCMPCMHARFRDVLSKSTDVLPESTTSHISYFRKVRPRPNGPFVSINTTTFDLSTLRNSHHALTYGRRYQFLHLHLSPTHKTTHPSSSTHPYPHLHCHTRQWRSTRSLPMATKTMQVHLLLSGRQIAKTSSTTLGVASMRKGEPSIRCIAT